jgi:hypothetical protein
MVLCPLFSFFRDPLSLPSSSQPSINLPPPCLSIHVSLAPFLFFFHSSIQLCYHAFDIPCFPNPIRFFLGICCSFGSLSTRTQPTNLLNGHSSRHPKKKLIQPPCTKHLVSYLYSAAAPVLFLSLSVHPFVSALQPSSSFLFLPLSHGLSAVARSVPGGFCVCHPLPLGLSAVSSCRDQCHGFVPLSVSTPLCCPSHARFTTTDIQKYNQR